MKAILQTLLIGGGFIGSLFFTPVAAYAWLMDRGFGGGVTGWAYMPFGCVAALTTGLLWRRLGRKHGPRRSPGHLTEDAAGAGE